MSNPYDNLSSPMASSPYDTSNIGTDLMSPSTNGPMYTMVVNSLSRSTGNTAFRDQIADGSSGAMSTHLGNSQDLAAEAMSDYNQSNMTEIQKNMNIIEATRDSGQDLNINMAIGADIGASPYDKMSPSVRPSAANTQFMGPSFNAMSVDSASFSPVQIENPLSFNPQMGLEDSVHNVVAGVAGVGIAGIGNNIERQTMVEIEKAAFVPRVKKSKINQELNRDVMISFKKSDGDSILVTPSGKGTNVASSITAPEEEEEEEKAKLKKQKKQTPTQERSSGTGFMRPVVAPKNISRSHKVKIKDNKQILDERLAQLNDEQFLNLVEKTSKKLNSSVYQEKVLATCKMSLLKTEATRRHSLNKIK